ncbi:hypothetical protein GOARA_030_00150, partial [Gordonia araii NBRC 100433]
TTTAPSATTPANGKPSTSEPAPTPDESDGGCAATTASPAPPASTRPTTPTTWPATRSTRSATRAARDPAATREDAKTTIRPENRARPSSTGSARGWVTPFYE